MNTKVEREKFLPPDLNFLLQSDLLRLNMVDISSAESFPLETQIMYQIPVVRQYFLGSVDKMRDTEQLVKHNLYVYKRFFEVFVKLALQLDPKTMNPEALRKEY